MSCHNPQIRREWRSLNTKEQFEFINAVQCLRSEPSKLHSGMSLYDDFPFLHDVVGDYAHDTAAFLTWHRYFIYLFEDSLRERCGYSSSLIYWDWSLDWKDLSKSPVFDISPGFGGDSHSNSEPSEVAIVGGDRCVNEGPFTNITVHWWTQQGDPHCLSRGFRDIQPISHMGYVFKPESIERLLQQPDYKQFFLAMEHSVHDGLQVAIGGDIMFNTAPYDPIFWLHHTQLDRLWWQWQQIHPSHQWQYLGPSSNISGIQASLDDAIPMGDFAPGLTAMELMSTESDILCYIYSE
ncbi:Di-copper centre-containing protein [Stipitochalara longipes BDJ]|nr:Di-copper centre-containing protein [Stipitochalara longipes BDJ]